MEKAFGYSLNRAVPEDLNDSCHLDVQEEAAALRRQVHAQAGVQDRFGEAGGRSDLSLSRDRQGRVRQGDHLQQRHDVLGGVHQHHVQQGAQSQGADLLGPAQRRAGHEDYRHAPGVRRQAVDGAGDHRVLRGDHLRQAGPAQDRRQGRAQGSGAAEDQDLQGRAVLPAQGAGLHLAEAEDRAPRAGRQRP